MNSPSPLEIQGKSPNCAPGGAKSGAVEPSKRPARQAITPDVQILIDAWPALPADVKAGILAMVRALERGR
jgi:hypothetical protein